MTLNRCLSLSVPPSLKPQRAAVSSSRVCWRCWDTLSPGLSSGQELTTRQGYRCWDGWGSEGSTNFINLSKLKVKIGKPTGWGKKAKQTLRVVGPLGSMWPTEAQGWGFAQSHPASQSFHWGTNSGLLPPAMEYPKSEVRRAQRQQRSALCGPRSHGKWQHWDLSPGL